MQKCDFSNNFLQQEISATRDIILYEYNIKSNIILKISRLKRQWKYNN